MEAAQKGNGDSTAVPSTEVAEHVEEPIVGPGPAPRARSKRPLQFEQAYLDSLPSANMYMIFFSFFGLLFAWFRALGFSSRRNYIYYVGLL